MKDIPDRGRACGVPGGRRRNMKIQKYNREKGCPKCGYLDTGDIFDYVTNIIERHCNRCGYEWAELPLDAKDEKL